ncbi:MAG: hypothetical protein EOP84_22900 [Verrucomicrobiaceae bacterium]|nr:MAG: hypothetical protein EOP84_22900 [Verrucomicrobiaceae bacterium]
MTTLNLNTLDRDSYVAFRAEWKTNYKALSVQIRDLKIEIKKQMRANSSFAGMNQNKIRSLQYEATSQLENLKDAKARLKEVLAETAIAA